ncbi:MAG: substrate-binding domain-containing protein [Puniceicoccaceae bacterium]
MPRQPSLKDIAKATGFSRPTVSRALNGQSCISEATKVKIRQVADQIGYRTDPVKSNLMRSYRGGSNQSAATVIAWFNEYPEKDYWRKTLFRKNFYEGALSQAEAHNLRIEPFWYKELGMTGTRLKQILVNRGIHGIIFPTPRYPVNEYGIDWTKFAVSFIGARPDAAGFSQILPDYFTNMEILLDELSKRGHRRIGLVLSKHLDWETERRVQARYALRDKSLRPKERVPILWEKKTGDLSLNFVKWVKRHQPECLIANRGETTQWLSEAGFSIPRDISLASFNVTEHTSSWAGIRINQRQMGALAVNSIVQDLGQLHFGPNKQVARLMIPGRWQEGETVRNLA